MTATVSTARELYERDSTFRAAIASWVEYRRCDLRLADYLMEYGLESQADCARWAATEPERPQYGEIKIRCGPYPKAELRVVSWYWYPDRYLDHANCVPKMRLLSVEGHNSHATPTDAILWLLDNWKPA